MPASGFGYLRRQIKPAVKRRYSIEVVLTSEMDMKSPTQCPNLFKPLKHFLQENLRFLFCFEVSQQTPFLELY
jgi:hypothetical protein